MAPTEALPLTISKLYVPYKAPDKASAFALRYVSRVVPDDVRTWYCPNIIGTFGAGYAKYVGCTGIFMLDSKQTAGGTTQYSDSAAWKISANVQRQNPLFNDTPTVQPPALQTLIIIKI